METLPASLAALCALAFALGARHGFDADHLATIDGITRYNAARRPRLARYAGVLFSLGHGAVVVAIAATVAGASTTWQPPAWLEATGVTISLVYLFALAFLNLRAVVAARPQDVVRPSGVRSGLVARVVTVQHPLAVFLVGVLFAASFDTVSQAALMSVAAERFGGITTAVGVASMFVAGMLAVDGLNGLFFARLVGNADRAARIASRVMAIGVALLSLAVALFTLAKLFAPVVDQWAEANDLAIGAVVALGAIATFVIGMLGARRERVSMRG